LVSLKAEVAKAKERIEEFNSFFCPNWGLRWGATLTHTGKMLIKNMEFTVGMQQNPPYYY